MRSFGTLPRSGIRSIDVESKLQLLDKKLESVRGVIDEQQAQEWRRCGLKNLIVSVTEPRRSSLRHSSSRCHLTQSDDPGGVTRGFAASTRIGAASVRVTLRSRRAPGSEPWTTTSFILVSSGSPC